MFVEIQNKLRAKDFSRWVEHYDEHLKNMYSIFIDLMPFNLTKVISYNKFCQYVYSNTRPTANPGSFKYVRPLIKYP